MESNKMSKAGAAIPIILMVVIVAGCLIIGSQVKDTYDASAPVVSTGSISIPETTISTTIPILSLPTTIPTYTEPTVTIPENTEPEVTEPPAPTEPTAPATTEMSDVELLACAIYKETGACATCMRYSADVILNRVNDPRFPNTIYHVLVAPRQYNTFSLTGVVWPERASSPWEADAVAMAWQIAEEALNGQHTEIYGAGYIWAAEFEQGTEGFWHCATYFGKS